MMEFTYLYFAFECRYTIQSIQFIQGMCSVIKSILHMPTLCAVTPLL